MYKTISIQQNLQTTNTNCKALKIDELREIVINEVIKLIRTEGNGKPTLSQLNILRLVNKDWAESIKNIYPSMGFIYSLSEKPNLIGTLLKIDIQRLMTCEIKIGSQVVSNEIEDYFNDEAQPNTKIYIPVTERLLEDLMELPNFRIVNLDLSYAPLGYKPATTHSDTDSGEYEDIQEDAETNSVESEEFQEYDEPFRFSPEYKLLLHGMLHKFISMASLNELNLYGTKVQNDGIALVTESIKGNQSLRSLNLGSNYIDNDNSDLCLLLEEFFDELNKSGIKHLDLSENYIENDGFRLIIEKLKENTTLESISLEQNDYFILDEAIITSLTELFENNQTLKHIKLSKDLLLQGGTRANVQALKELVESHKERITVEFK